MKSDRNSYKIDLFELSNEIKSVLIDEKNDENAMEEANKFIRTMAEDFFNANGQTRETHPKIWSLLDKMVPFQLYPLKSTHFDEILDEYPQERELITEQLETAAAATNEDDAQSEMTHKIRENNVGFLFKNE